MVRAGTKLYRMLTRSGTSFKIPYLPALKSGTSDHCDFHVSRSGPFFLFASQSRDQPAPVVQFPPDAVVTKLVHSAKAPWQTSDLTYLAVECPCSLTLENLAFCARSALMAYQRVKIPTVTYDRCQGGIRIVWLQGQGIVK